MSIISESEMSERPTPETDAFAKAMYSRGVDSHHDGREALKHAKRLERERDEAREKIKELIYIAGRAIELAEIDFENDKFGVVSELRDGLKKIKKEAK